MRVDRDQCRAVFVPAQFVPAVNSFERQHQFAWRTCASSCRNAVRDVKIFDVVGMLELVNDAKCVEKI